MPNYRLPVYHPMASLVALALTTAPLLLTSCQRSPSATTPPQNHSMVMADTPMADHAMTMELGPQDAEFDLRFLDGMVLHHQGAMAMAKALQDQSQRPEMQQLATDIITAQAAEIEQMQQWRQAWYPNASPEPVMYDAQMGHAMAMTPDMQKAMMMSPDLGQADDEFDLRFINAMIPHHEGALTMAQQALNSDRPELREVAETILTTQQAEISQMQQWRQSWYGQ